MAGLLTGSRPDSFPISRKPVEKVYIETLNGVLQQRGLSGIFTRFPFHPVDVLISRNQFVTKVMDLLKILFYFLDISDDFV